MTIKQLRKRIEKWEKSNELLLLQAVRDNQQHVLDVNREQLMEGKTSENKSVGKYQSPSYAKYKKKLNPRGVVDLKVTGKFHKSFFLNTREFPIVFEAKDKKTVPLTEKYGNEIFGIAAKNEKKVNEPIQQSYLAKVRELLGI